MSKRINLHFFRTGLIKRYGYYRTKTGAACAQALLEKFGWNASQIKHLPVVDEYYVFAEVRNHKPTINRYTVVTDSRKNKSE